tara:strand:- start:1819 stop:3285 length:1467 start_codon:yes stop_codon:yes gene_type:complete
MHNINAVALNLHDHNVYDGKLHRQMERYTRFKHNLKRKDGKLDTNNYDLNNEFVNEYFKKTDGVLAFSYTIGGIRMIKEILDKEFLDFVPKKLYDFVFKDDIYYCDHHQSHAVYAFINSGFEFSDILAIDGIGAKFRCIFVDKDENIKDLSKELPLGWLWNQMSKLTGFGSLGASKLMGLVGYGSFNQYYYDVFETIVSGDIREKNYDIHKLINIAKYGREDLAFTLQKFTLDKIKEHIYPLKTCENLCIAGGVAYNGYMNEEFTKHYENVYVPPAVGDEGQAIGVYQHANVNINNIVHKSKTFGGQEYDFPGFIFADYEKIAKEIANGKIVGWFQDKSESGNRALGNRSILADPRRKDIKDIINKTIKMREDFRPFAPAVLEDHYKDYFDTNLPSPYMSRICKVKSDKVPGITHVDGTARIQTVNRKFNQKFYDIINAFYKETGVPMLLNTSFNCQEPIVETPAQALDTFKKTALDILVINDKVIYK